VSSLKGKKHEISPEWDGVFLDDTDFERIKMQLKNDRLRPAVSRYRIRHSSVIKREPPAYVDEMAEDVALYLKAHTGEQLLCLNFNQALYVSTRKEVKRIYPANVYKGAKLLSEQLSDYEGNRRPMVVNAEIDGVSYKFLRGVVIEMQIEKGADIRWTPENLEF